METITVLGTYNVPSITENLSASYTSTSPDNLLGIKFVSNNDEKEDILDSEVQEKVLTDPPKRD